MCSMNENRPTNLRRHAKTDRVHSALVIPWASDSWQPRRRLLLGLAMWNREPAFTRGYLKTIITKLLFLKSLSQYCKHANQAIAMFFLACFASQSLHTAACISSFDFMHALRDTCL